MKSKSFLALSFCASIDNWIMDPKHKQSQQVHMPYFGQLYRNKNNLYNVLFLIIGLSLGITATLCFNSLFSSLQAFQYPTIIPNATLLPLSLSPPLETSSSSQDTNFNSTNTKLKTSLMHNMTDQELYLKASLISGIQDFPENAIPKVAFMFLAKGPLPLAPLWEKFFKGHDAFYNIYLHQHPSYNETMSQESVFYGRNIPSQIVKWGRISLMDATKRLIANAVMDKSNRHFVMISESCIPLFGFRTTYDYLINSSKSFVNSFDQPTYDARGRYPQEMKPLINITNWRKGSNWVQVRRDLAIHIVSDTKYYPLFWKNCLFPCFAEEHYIQTFVDMLYPQLSSNRTVTWVDWSRGGPHPRFYVGNDITYEFLNHMRFGSKCDYEGNPTYICFLFARKFHPNTLKPLLRLLSPMLLGVDT